MLDAKTKMPIGNNMAKGAEYFNTVDANCTAKTAPSRRLLVRIHQLEQTGSDDFDGIFIVSAGHCSIFSLPRAGAGSGAFYNAGSKG